MLLKNPTNSRRAIQQNLFSLLLQTSKSIREVTQIHAQVVVNGFSQKNFILVKLISFYITFGRFLYARRAFENIKNPSTGVWNQMIKGCGAPRESVEFYNQMVVKGKVPDGFTYSFLLRACARSGGMLLREGQQVHGRVLINGFCSNEYVSTNLLNWYASDSNNGSINFARRVFDEMSERNLVCWNSLLSGYIRCGDVAGARRIFDEMPERNVVSWTTMLAGCVQNAQPKQALFLFNEMQVAAGVELDQIALVSALSACAQLGDLKMGEWIHNYYIKERFDSQKKLVSLNNALIHMYASCGEIQKAYQVFQNMQKTSSVVSWTSMITGFAKQGFAKEALVIFQRMLRCKIRPDEISFLGVLCACSHAGLVDHGQYFFNQMIHNWGIKPTIQHYCCLVDLLSRAGFLDEAVTLIETMPEKPNHAVWGALLGGCRIHKNANLASKVAQQLSFEPEHAMGYLMLLKNVYAAAKRWQDVSTVERKMVEMGVRKPAGKSWVQAIEHRNGSLI